jgi:HlyD family secretion protein
LNVGTPEQVIALPVVKKRRMRTGVKTAVLAMVLAAIVVYVIFYYFNPRIVEGLRVAPAIVDLEISGPALLDARNRVTITARIQGYLKTVNVDRNDPVKVGQVLAQLESEDIANQVAASVANAEAADRAISEARSDQERAQAAAEKGKLDYDRKRGLREKNIITEGEWVATVAVYRQTQAELARSATTIARASAISASAEANVKLLEVRLRDATIRSPLNGVVVSRDRNVGDLILPSMPLLQLVDPSSIILSARFDESAMGTIAPGQSASLHFASMPTETLKGTVLRVIRLVDQETREFTIDITPDQLPSDWALGQRANVTIKAPCPVPAIVIPQNLTARRNGRGVGVWLLRHGRAVWAQIDLGYPSGKEVQVVNGLSAGDIVIHPEGTYLYEPIIVKESGG